MAIEPPSVCVAIFLLRQAHFVGAMHVRAQNKIHGIHACMQTILRQHWAALGSVEQPDDACISMPNHAHLISIKQPNQAGLAA